MQFRRTSRLLAAFCALSFAPLAFADDTYHILSSGDFSQDWSNTGLITTNDVWSGVPSIIGYRGDGLAAGTGADPQTVLGVGTQVVDVNANQTNPNSFGTGGVTEFELVNPSIALAGSGTAKAPSIVLHLDSSGRENIHISYTLRDLETGTDPGVQRVALQYRISDSSDFVNVPEGYVAAATNATSLPVTPVSVTLPAETADQATLQVRIITTDAAGNDRWVGVDDILVTSTGIASGPSDLFFSEYIEGSSNNKALEIFNGTGEDVDLANYKVRIEGFTNAGNPLAVATLTFASPTMLEDGDAYVVCHNSANEALSEVCDLKTTNGALFFTGDDSLTLLHTIEGVDTIIDIIGQIGVDPGDAWGTPPTSTQNNTIRRKPAVCVGDTNGADAFDPSVEWDGFAIDTFDGLGTHEVECSGGNEPEPILPVVSFASGTISANEGDTLPNTLTFAVQFTAIAAGETVTFNIDVVGDAARFDYAGPASVILSDTDESPYLIQVQTVPNTDTDGDAIVEVTLSGFFGADVSQADPVSKSGTIVDDDIPFIAINAIQGDGALSPLDGQVVTTRGIVTGVIASGSYAGKYYIQSLPEDDDADDATSEGLFVFGATAAHGVAVGDLVYVTGRVDEYSPATGALPITELVAPVTTQILSSGHSLPAPVALTAADLDPAGPVDQLERYEYMRVTIPRFVVTAPTSTGVRTDEFFGVIEGTDRPFRESGVNLFRCGVNPAVPGSVALPVEAPENVPCWDHNPELVRVKSNYLVGGQATPVRSGTVMENLTGVLDYSFQRYSILTRTAEAPTLDLSTQAMGTSVTTPIGTEVTIGAFNVENLAVAGGTTYSRKADKIAQTIVDYLYTPDVLGLIEVANLATLEDIATRVGTIAQDDPDYQAVLLATSGSQRLGFLIKRALVGGEPRVTLLDAWESIAENNHVLCPDGVSYTSGLLNDRDPLVIEVLIRGPNGASWPVTIINNHLKSMIDLESNADAGAGYGCFNDTANPGGGEGRRNRAKRQQNAEYLAMLVDTLQVAQPDQPIVLVGDFNAYEFSDGLADLLGTVKGEPSANDETVVPADGHDLVEPNLVLLTELMPPQERYSYTFDGNAQTIDHILVSDLAIAATVGVRAEFARVNADFHQVDASTDTHAFANSDHDPVLAFLDVATFRTADLSLSTTPAVAEVHVGAEVVYAFELTNNGQDDAALVRVELGLPANVPFLSIISPAGWTCDISAISVVICTIELMGLDEVAAFSITAQAAPESQGTTAVATVAVSSGSIDPTPVENASFTTVITQLEPDIFADGFED